MNGMNAYLKLVDHGRPIDIEQDDYDPAPSLQHLLEYAHEHDGLDVEGPWRLDTRECRRLEAHTGFSPAGGWKGLSGLAAGCGVLRAGLDGFAPHPDPGHVATWLGGAARRHLLEAFTRSLVPPSAAAGIFLLAAVHPVWGLRLAYDVNPLVFDSRAPGNKASSEPRIGWRDETVLPGATLEAVHTAVFGTIACTLATLRQLDPARKYPVDALAGLFEAACELARRVACTGQDTEVFEGLPPFISDENRASQPHHRVVDFTTQGIIDTVFVPAGAIRRFDDDTFCVLRGAFDQVRVADLDPERQNTWLSWLLSGEVVCEVA